MRRVRFGCNGGGLVATAAFSLHSQIQQTSSGRNTTAAGRNSVLFLAFLNILAPAPKLGRWPQPLTTRFGCGCMVGLAGCVDVPASRINLIGTDQSSSCNGLGEFGPCSERHICNARVVRSAGRANGSSCSHRSYGPFRPIAHATDTHRHLGRMGSHWVCPRPHRAWPYGYLDAAMPCHDLQSAKQTRGWA